GIVMLGRIRFGLAGTLVWRYFGRNTTGSCPRAARALGSAPTTSASPPVLENGTHSEAANAIRIKRHPGSCEMRGCLSVQAFCLSASKWNRPQRTQSNQRNEYKTVNGNA